MPIPWPELPQKPESLFMGGASASWSSPEHSMGIGACERVSREEAEGLLESGDSPG